MYRMAHTLSCLFLALALVLTGSGGAGPANGATLHVICGSDGTSTLWLDADGSPVDPGEHHPKCLNCLLSTAVLPEPAAVLTTLIPLRTAAGPARPAPPLSGPVAHLRPDLRGPPAMLPGDRRDGDRRTNTRLPHQPAFADIDIYQSYLQASVIDLRATMQSAPS